MAIVGNDSSDTDDQADAGPAPLNTEFCVGPGTEGSFNVGYLAASGGEVVTEMHCYIKTRDRDARTVEGAIFTYNRQHNDEDFNGTPEDLYSDIIEIADDVDRTTDWYSVTGLNIELSEEDDYCMVLGSPDADSMVYYGDDLFATSRDDAGMSLSDVGATWDTWTFHGSLNLSAYWVYTPVSSNTNMKINVGDSFKDISEIKINIGDTWKDVSEMKINIGDTWKTIF